jgi:hypothetical protein
VEELVARIVVKLIDNGFGLFGADEHLKRQPKSCVIAVNAHGTKTKLSGHPQQVDAGDRRQKIGLQPNDIKRGLIDLHDSLKKQWNFFSGPRELSRQLDLIRNLHKTQDERLVIVKPLLPEIAEA